MSPRLMRNSFIYLLITVAVLAIFFTLFSDALGGSKEIPVSEVLARSLRGEIERIEVRGDRLAVFSTSGESYSSRKEEGASMLDMLSSAGVATGASGVLVDVKGTGGLGSLFGILINSCPSFSSAQSCCS